MNHPMFAAITQRRRRAATCLALLSGVLLSGCASRLGYAPRPAFPIDRDITELHQQFDTAASIKDYYAGAQTAERRNTFIAGRLTLYDLEYIRFVSRFRLGRAAEATAFDAVALGVGFATTIAGGAHTKSILGAVTTALTGARTSYEKNFYDDKTAVALVTQMTAERKTALIPIVGGAKASIGEYPMTTAISDLTAYQIAGTIDGALAGVQRDAAVKDVKATAMLDQYRTIAYAPDDASERIRKWIFLGIASTDPDGTVRDATGKAIEADDGHYAQLQAELVKLKLDGIAFQNFLGSAALADARATVTKDLSIP